MSLFQKRNNKETTHGVKKTRASSRIWVDKHISNENPHLQTVSTTRKPTARYISQTARYISQHQLVFENNVFSNKKNKAKYS